MNTPLKGTILGYSDDVSAGVIKTQDGAKFQFNITDWLSHHPPQANSDVNFYQDGNRAVKVEVA